MSDDDGGKAAAVEGDHVDYDDADNHDDGKKTTLSASLVARLHGTRTFFWDAETKEFLGRTWKSWAKIGIFYVIFYSGLALFFAVMLAGFFSTLDDRHPTQTGLRSLIKSNPGMGFRPQPSIESTLIRFRQGENSSYVKLIDNIDDYLKEYRERSAEVRGMNCSELPANYSHGDDRDSFCEFDIDSLGTECTRQNNDYGYGVNKPCVLLKMNRVYDWMPRPFTDHELNDVDDEFAQEARQALGSRLDSQYVGVNCDGENEGDRDNLHNISYYPDKGFALKYYPYYNQPNYLPPVVFVQFDTPREGVLIQIWCKLWVSNIKHHKNDKAGSTHFELFVN